MTTKIHIDEVYAKGEISPLRLNFQNGYTTEEFKTQQYTIFHNKNNDKKAVAVELDGLIYAGDEEVEDLGKSLILAKNRNTGKVRLIEAGTVELKAILKIKNNTSELLETSNLELSRKFGSKKQKQQMEQKEKFKVNIQTVTEQMQNVTEHVTEDKLDISAYNKSDSDDFYVPPIDRAALKAENVYDINKILTHEQFERIYSELEDKDYTAEMPQFIKNIVNGRKLSEKHTVLAVYATVLLKLYTAFAKDFTKKSYVACPHSATLNEIIISNFMTTTNGRRARPTPYKDKSLCYAMVLLFLINNLKLDLHSLCQDTKLTVTNAATKVRVTGATVISVGGKKTAHLKLPLNFKSNFRRKSAKF